ncbi:thiamine monophosphate kinase [Actinomyces radicidentis]|uniref:Thiamine-monophosphate kinase n=1 Tax=Actinomyces radicidentis TaxID=111015 RepID=A0A0X8JHR5_ACTRD|nr:thiamine monophosphate kinase [Actinomyces radicidentis]
MSEEALLAAFTPLLPGSDHALVGNGDDCAVLAAPDGRYAVSTDVLVEGHHFRTDWSSAREIGARAAAQNLADAAAMGARPTALVMSLVLPGTTPVAWVQDLARGLAEACAPVGAGVVGGDLSGGESLVLAVTVHGDLEGRAPVLRSGARPGNLLVHVGAPGRSLAGYELLAAGWEPEPGGPATGAAGGSGTASQPGSVSAADTARRCEDLFRAPRPPLAAGPALAGAGATAMMDVSDSLLRDAGRIARASGVLIDVDDPADPGSPLHADLLALAPVAGLLETDDDAARARARRWVLTGGEDHGMLATVPADAVGSLPQGAAVIGRVSEPGEGGPGVVVGGRPWEGSVGWDHFSA